MSHPTTVPTRLWRIAGALALAHVVLMLGGVVFESTPVLGDPPADQSAALLHGSLVSTMAGGYAEYLGFLVFLAFAVLLARLLRGSGEVQRWFGSCIAGAGVVYVAITLAVGFPAGAAATYEGHHGAPLMTAMTVNDIRNFGYFLSVGVLGVFTLAAAAAIRATGLLPRWLAWTGYLVGAASLAAVPAARVGAIDYANIAWLVWFVALAVVALRGPRTTSSSVTEPEFARV